MKILITGGAGYLGSVLTPRLLFGGHEVTVLDTFEHHVPSLADACRSDKLTIVRGSVTDVPLLGKLLVKADAVCHLAAVVGADACNLDPRRASDLNGNATHFLKHMMSPEQALIYPCTNSGYGVGGVAECDETSELNPLTVYGRTKVEGERAVMQRANSVSLRLATLFGWSPRMRRDLLVNDLVWRAVNDRTAVIYEGHFRRNFCHVRDAAMAFGLVLGNWSAMRGQIYNVGDTCANMSKWDLCDVIMKHVPQFEPILSDVGSDPDKRDYVVSNAKIEATGWHPHFSLDDGIQELVRGYNMMRRNDYGNY